MKKVILLALIAMMLLSMVAMTACKPKAEEVDAEDIAPAEDIVEPDTLIVEPEIEAPAAE
ncbi:MAG: hypothetical protein PHC50_06750 [Candidatus Cloacimonetes bacterium]|nr:hypothetical protein [Candidatus Cloacimonadota bacterium]